MKRKRQKEKLQPGKLLLILLLFSMILACGKVKPVNTNGTNTKTSESDEDSSYSSPNLSSDAQMQVQYLDVGQGDATLISCDGHFMLIDAGNNNQGTQVSDYLKQQKISSLDYVIGTHPDADHIGGLDVVIHNYDCVNLFLPTEQKDTVTYRDVLHAIDDKGYQSVTPSVGSTYSLGSAEFTIVGPSGKAADSNDNSIALILHYGNNSFYFEGDAQEEEESSIMTTGIPIAANVYKIGHHGSDTSTSDRMLEAVQPVYAVISVGDNDYGHPNAEVLNKLRKKGIQLFRTDEQGTIVATSDGEHITWNCSPTESWKAGEAAGGSTVNTQASDVTVHITKTGTKYHLAGCEYLKDSDTEISLSEAKAGGYEPCGVCHPPK